jgi:hydrophobic/amphiphilic exporter-1 (mainly G- bacteria), HAE1 family
MSLSGAAIRRPVAVAMFFIAVVLLGVISFTRLPIDLLPDVAYPKLVIYTTYPNVGPTEVERFVSEPIEQQVASVPGVERVQSVSREGVSLVTLRFAWGTDMDFAALNVRERLDNLRGSLPELADRPAVLRTDPGSEPVMALAVAGITDLGLLKELAETVVQRRLEQVDGVAQAAVTGGLEREIHVEVDPRRLEAHGVTIAQLAQALASANASAPGGTVQRGRYRYTLRTLGEFDAVGQINDVVIGRSAAGATLTVRDVGVVSDGHRDRESIARFDGTESVGLLIYKESGANTVQVADRVETVLGQLREEFPELRLEVAMSQAGFVSAAIRNVVQALLYGAGLAFLVLFLFLRDVRYPIAIALAIPISVVATFGLMHATGISLNIMSLGGLALGVGMLVDNSIVVLENIFRHRQRGLKGSVAAAVGADEVKGAITASTLTTIAVFGPIVYVEGVAGELFGALSLAVAFSLSASLVVALTILPAMAARWELRAAPARHGVLRRAAAPVTRPVGRALDGFDRGFARFTERYERTLGSALDRRGRVVAGALVLLAGALVLGYFLDRAVLPDVDHGGFQARVDLPRGTPLEETDGVATRLERVFGADPDVAAVFTRVGRQGAVAGVEEEESGLNTALLEVRLREGASTARVLERLRPRLDAFPPGTLAIETGQATALGRLLGGGDADLAVRVRSDDLGGALTYATELSQRLSGRAELRNVRVGTELGQPEVRVEIDRERAAAYGIDPREIAETVEAYMRGQVATRFSAFDRRIPVVVRLPEEARLSLATLDHLRVRDVPLRELVFTRESVGPAETRRLDQGRYVPVYADLARVDVERAVAAVGAAIADFPPPAGMRVEVGGENEEMRKSFRELGCAFLLALLLVYMIMAAQFESFVHPFTVLLSVPLALIGALFALALVGGGINSMSLIGAIILGGIVVNDAIVKVDFINRARRSGMAVRAAIIAAGRARLRPILMTTATTLFGVLPMAIGIGRGADLRAPLAVTVFGGLASATVLTLVVVPAAYSLFAEAGERLRRAVGLAPAEAVPLPAAPTLVPAGSVEEA